MTIQRTARLLLAIILTTFSVSADAIADSHHRMNTRKIPAKHPPLQAQIAEIEDGEILIEYKKSTLPALDFSPRIRPDMSPQMRPDNIPPPAARPNNISTPVRPDNVSPLAVRPNNISTHIKPDNIPPPPDNHFGNKGHVPLAILNQLMKDRKIQMNAIAKDIQKRIPITIRSTYPALGVQLLKVDKGKTIAEILSSLQKEPSILRASPNYKIYPEDCSRPPSNSPKCAPPRDGHWRAGHLWGMEKIGMENAWNRPVEHEVVVAVLDTGIDYHHPDLARNMWENPGENPANGPDNIDNDQNGIADDLHGANFCTQNPTGDVMDRDGHGTMVAGIIAARGNNWNGIVSPDRDGQWQVTSSKTGLVGVHYRAKLMALKILCNSPEGPTGTIARAIQAIDYAGRHGAKILNNSWGLSGVPQEHLEILKAAIMRSNCQVDTSDDHDCKPALFVASAGNNGQDNDTHDHYPSNFNTPDVENVIAVAASTEEDELWRDSGGGPGGSNWGKQRVHIAAPGANILSTYLRNQENGATLTDGTSMAAPHVSGCAALLLGQKLSASSSPLLPRDLKNILTTTGDTPQDAEGKNKLKSIRSAQRLNCANAMARVLQEDH